MANDFKAVQPIILQPASVSNSYQFEFAAAESSGAKGSIPYGTSVSTATVSGSFAETSEDVSSELISEAPTVLSNIVTVLLDYPTNSGEGKYNLRFILTLDDGSVWEFDFTSIQAVNI